MILVSKKSMVDKSNDRAIPFVTCFVFICSVYQKDDFASFCSHKWRAIVETIGTILDSGRRPSSPVLNQPQLM